MNAPARRTQQERRESTIAKLLDATIVCLIEHGYRDTSISRITGAAGVSHGGLFRHFSSRTELIAAAAEEIGQRHLHRLKAELDRDVPVLMMLDPLVSYLRQATRNPLSAAWREVMVAARSDAELREAVAPAVQRFEDAVIRLASEIKGGPGEDREFGTLILSLLHMFDSEATTVIIVETEDIELRRHTWAVELLRTALQESPAQSKLDGGGGPSV